MENKLNELKQNQNYKKGIELEKIILKERYDLENELRIFDVSINLNGKDTFIHSYCSGEVNIENLVLLHGFGGSGLTYFKMIKTLSKRFRVYTLDFIGMGLSDRQDFNVIDNTTQVINFFVNSIEQWRKAIGIQKFKLAGHSFGGYMAANYAVKYPEYTEEVFLLSPMAGTQVHPEEDFGKKENFEKYVESQSLLKKLFLKYVNNQINVEKTSLGEFMQKWYVPRCYIINRIVSYRMKINDKKEKLIMEKFFKKTYIISPKSTEHYLYSLINLPFAQAKYSIEQMISENFCQINMKFTIMFGDDDWMSITGCQRLFDNYNLIGKFIIIKNAGHQLPFDQPENIAAIINESPKIN